MTTTPKDLSLEQTLAGELRKRAGTIAGETGIVSDSAAADVARAKGV